MDRALGYGPSNAGSSPVGRVYPRSSMEEQEISNLSDGGSSPLGDAKEKVDFFKNF